jgi:hypothetical protein
MDPLGYPLLNDTLGKSLKPGATFRDPCVFEDDDGEFYIISGVFKCVQITAQSYYNLSYLGALLPSLHKLRPLNN